MSRKGYKHVKHDELIIINDIGRVCNACPHFKRWEEFPLNKGCNSWID